jgi:hypothetical protein
MTTQTATTALTYARLPAVRARAATCDSGPGKPVVAAREYR